MDKPLFRISFFVLLLITISTFILSYLKLEFIDISLIYFGLIIFWIIFFSIFNNSVNEFIKYSNSRYPHFYESMNSIFNTLLIIYLGLLLFQEFNLFLVINSNFLLIFVIIFGIFAAISEQKTVVKKTNSIDYILVWILGVVTFFLILIKTSSLGWLSYIISIISSSLIILIGYLIYDNNDYEEKEIEINKKTIINTILILFCISLVLFYFIGFSSFRIIFGSVYSLFLPGFILTYALFEKNEIESLERVALSFALSISIVPLVIFYLNLIGMKINLLNVSIVILLVCIIEWIIVIKKIKIKNKFKSVFKK